MAVTDKIGAMVARELSEEVMTRFNRYASTLLALKASRQLPYLSKQEVMKELNISDGTLTTWENNGLKRYKPNYKTSLVFYLIDEICQFIVLDD